MENAQESIRYLSNDEMYTLTQILINKLASRRSLGSFVTTNTVSLQCLKDDDSLSSEFGRYSRQYESIQDAYTKALEYLILDLEALSSLTKGQFRIEILFMNQNNPFRYENMAFYNSWKTGYVWTLEQTTGNDFMNELISKNQDPKYFIKLIVLFKLGTTGMLLDDDNLDKSNIPLDQTRFQVQINPNPKNITSMQTFYEALCPGFDW